MRKLLFIIALLFLSTPAMARKDNSNSKEQKFVNPIFYQPLRPLSSTVGWAYLTPTSIDFRTPLDKNIVNATGQCELVENEQDHITFLCDITWLNIAWLNEKVKKYYTYVIKDLFSPDCLRIWEFTYKNVEDFSQDAQHASKYCVTPLSNISSENY